MDRKSIVRKVAAKLILGGNFIDWASKFLSKFNIKIPSKEEAKKLLSKTTKEDIQDAYKKIPSLQSNISDKISISIDLKKTMLILVSLAILGGGKLPSNVAKACESAESCSLSAPKESKTFAEFSKKEINKAVTKVDNIEEVKKKLVALADIRGDVSEDKDRPVRIFGDSAAQRELTSVPNILTSEWVYLGH